MYDIGRLDIYPWRSFFKWLGWQEARKYTYVNEFVIVYERISTVEKLCVHAEEATTVAVDKLYLPTLLLDIQTRRC